MSANNNSSPPWYPEYEPSLSARTNDWMRLFTDNVYSLRGTAASINETVQNFNSSVTKSITSLAANISAAASAKCDVFTIVPSIKSAGILTKRCVSRDHESVRW